MGKDLDSWKFDQEVTDIFEDMLKRSIPQLDVMRKAVTDITARQFKAESGAIIDLGCSRGDAIAPLLAKLPNVFMHGIEVSEPMYKVAKDRFSANGNVMIEHYDLRKGLPKWLADGYKVRAALSVFTLQFIPINYRQELLQDIYRNLEPGGVFILVEKVLGDTATINNTMVDLYHSLKHENGYSYEEINRKALMLEGVLVPVTSAWNEELLRQAGFESDCFWRWMNFAGWVAYKRG